MKLLTDQETERVLEYLFEQAVEIEVADLKATASYYRHAEISRWTLYTDCSHVDLESFQFELCPTTATFLGNCPEYKEEFVKRLREGFEKG